MQLRPPPGPLPPVDDVPTALRQAARQLGQLPAVTVYLPGARHEQGVASLSQWAAKGAHLLELDLMLTPGDRVRLDAPASWTTAAVALAVWWTGGVVALEGDATIAVLDPARRPPASAHEVLHVGDGIDGAPTSSQLTAWTHEAQPMPDDPPMPRGTAASPALLAGGRSFDQASLLAMAARQGDGTVGVEDEKGDAVDQLVAIALRPLVTGRPTVIVRGVARDVADGERVATWR